MRLAALLITLLIASIAHADCKSALGINFTANQKTSLCSVFGSAVQGSVIPGADNTYDVGSSSLGWRTGYFDTSLVTPLVSSSAAVVLQADADAQRLFNFDASSDTALTMTFGDAGVTATQNLTIRPSTADADDDAFICLAGGSACSRNGGAFLIVNGNELASVGGDMTLSTGAGAADVMYFYQAAVSEMEISASAISIPENYLSFGAGLVARVDADAQRLHTWDASSDTALTQTFGDGGTTASQVLDISSGTADGDDDTILRLSGGGAYSNTGSRGAALYLGGDQANNDAILNAGATAGGDVVLSAPASDGIIYMQQAGATKWTFGTAGTMIGAGTASIGWAVVAGANTACTTTCVTPAVFGLDGTTLVGPSDATADICLCAGAS
jgi:hypothetical protein